MHEVSLIESVVAIVADELRRQSFSRVRMIRLQVGALGHAEPDALRFCFDAVTSGMIADGAKLLIEGDQQTSRDAERIRATGVQAVQINTGKGCHLDAHMVGHALDRLPSVTGGLLFIENVGNLMCPAAFDLGEASRVVVLSVTEGEDKPLKYPDMFVTSDLMLLNKSDLLPHLDFDVGACVAAALRVNPRIQILTVSARTGEGLAGFYALPSSTTCPTTGKYIDGGFSPLRRLRLRVC